MYAACDTQTDVWLRRSLNVRLVSRYVGGISAQAADGIFHRWIPRAAIKLQASGISLNTRIVNPAHLYLKHGLFICERQGQRNAWKILTEFDCEGNSCPGVYDIKNTWDGIILRCKKHFTLFYNLPFIFRHYGIGIPYTAHVFLNSSVRKWTKLFQQL